jgi:DNA polymerase-3 subunit alpha
MRRSTYVPLHGHTTYSIGDGVTRIDDLIERLKEIKAPAAGLTEHGNMSSFLKFYRAAKANNINPILGCELYINELYYKDRDKFLELKKNNKNKDKEEFDDTEEVFGDIESPDNNHQIVYATNYEGLRKIIHLSNKGFYNFYYKPLVNLDLVYNDLDFETNILTTGCLNSYFNKAILDERYDEAERLIKKFHDKFSSNFYLEIQFNNLEEQTKVNNFYIDFFKKTNIKPLLSLDYHYANKDDWEIQYLLYVIKGRKTVKTLSKEEWFYSVRDLYIREIDLIYDYAKKQGFDEKILNIAVDSTFEVNDKVKIEIPDYPNNNPRFLDSKDESAKVFNELLKRKFNEKINSGLIPKDKISEYSDRLDYEMNVIKDKDVIDYFLILDDIIQNHVYKNGGGLGAGRGSAGGSLVLFVTDITKIDPIKHNLIFARFINPARKDPPDIDTDIDSETQKTVEDYLKQKYGLEKVCHIANFGKFGPKTIVKDLCRVFELDFYSSNELTKLFSDKSAGSVKEELSNAKSIATKTGNTKLVNFIDENKDLLIKYGEKFTGMVRQFGRHASGILISNKNLTESDIPISRLKGNIITGVQEGGDEREVTELGYLKLDILGLINASVMNNAFKLIRERHGVDSIEQKILQSDMTDEKVYDEFRKGNCRDIFQFGSDNMISFIQKVKPVNIDDLCAINAGWRPAIIVAGGVDEYIEGRDNPEQVKYKLDKIHKDLYPILAESAGVPLFQEQIMFILQAIGGFSLAEADKGRKILKLLHKGNQDKNEAFIKLLEQFKNGAKQKEVSDENIEYLLDRLGKYSEYSFNKCLSSDTNVMTKNGNKKIFNVKLSDKVFSFDFEKQNVYESKVKKIYKNGKKKIFQFVLDTGETFKCTKSHKFMTENGEMETVENILKKNLKIVIA